MAEIPEKSNDRALSDYKKKRDDVKKALDAFLNFEEPKINFYKPEIFNNSSIVTVPKSEQKVERNYANNAYVNPVLERWRQQISNNFLDANLSSLASINVSGLSLETTRQSISETNHRDDLPIFEYRGSIIQNIEESPIIIIQGQTGCGKTTQVPQYILDDCKQRKLKCKILITQPRKIAAITNATRVAQERNSLLGIEVGYQVGLSKVSMPSDSDCIPEILYCTTGVVLQKLIFEKSMARYSHIIIDEVHQRDIEIDLLLVVIRRLLSCNSRQTKIILMSATMDKLSLMDYFKIPLEDGEFYWPPVINLSDKSRKYKIKEFYLDMLITSSLESLQHFDERTIIDYNEPGIKEEMYEFVVRVISLINMVEQQNKNMKIIPRILVFLPGINEIEILYSKLTSEKIQKLFTNEQIVPSIHILHSTISIDEQKKVFENTNTFEIILSTNIAESSVTIPKITHVIDFCLTKYQSASNIGGKVSSLTLNWCSKNNCEQRAGRTARNCDGNVIRLVHKNFFMNKMEKYPPPEMKLMPLESAVIKVKSLNMGSPIDTFALALDPPNLRAISNAVLHLKELGGLQRLNDSGQFDYFDGNLTFLGRIMGTLPIDVTLSKFIALGYVFSCLHETIIISAGLSLKCIFTNQQLREEVDKYVKKLEFAKGSGSDLIAILNAYNEWKQGHEDGRLRGEDYERKWCKRHNIDRKNIREMGVLVKEITNRLQDINIKPNLETFQDCRDKIFMIKICAAGAFGAGNFFVLRENTKEDEMENLRLMNNHDVLRTVFFTKMDRYLFGDVYKDQIKEFFIKNNIIDKQSEVKISFNYKVSEKVYVTFEDKHEIMIEAPTVEEDNIFLGKVVPEVYKSVKLKKNERINFTLMVSNQNATEKYAVECGFGKMEGETFIPFKNYVKYPGWVVEPTKNTSKMQGFITHIESPNKFYFRPIIATCEHAKITDDRYGRILSEIKSKIAGAKRVPGYKHIENGRLVLIEISNNNDNKTIERGVVVGCTAQGSPYVNLLDVGKVVTGNKTTTFMFADINFEKELLKYPSRVIRCTLKNIQPSSTLSSQGKWTQKAIQSLNQLVGQRVAIFIHSVVNGVVSVRLVSAGKEKVDWNSKLLQDGFAEYCQESYLSQWDNQFRRNAQLNDQPQMPEVEFAEKIDENLESAMLNVSSPPGSRKPLKLIGPFSPLEADVYPIVRYNIRVVSVDHNSVNSVIFNDDECDGLTGLKFYVAADITTDSKENRLTIRETTFMPKTRGVAVILALIFSPTAEIRRDEEKTKFVSILTGLGFDGVRKAPFYGERDAVLNIDFDFSIEDVIKINHLREAMSVLLQTDPTTDHPNIHPEFKVNLMKRIQTILKDLLERKRVFLPNEISVNRYQWNVEVKDDDDYITLRESSEGCFELFEAIKIPKIHEVPSKETLQ